uniref:F-box domain-containing protein n=2 Tax=Chenopodium quinoa TaxID=63459 RepID=A0A803LVP6_CHEQI
MQLKLFRAESGTTTVWSWDEMNYDVLLKIMKRVPLGDRLCVACLVSKTWLSAVLDSMSPPGVINLKRLDCPKFQRMNNRYLVFLKRRLDTMPVDSCSAFYHGETFLQEYKYRYIAKRTPSMQKLIIPRAVRTNFTFISPAMKYWKKLKKVQCPSVLIAQFRRNFTKVETLRLFGAVDDDIATIIRDRCPQLKRLRLDYCALSINALSIILDGHKDLELLDTRHSFRVPDCRILFSDRVSPCLEWNEEEIRSKAAGVKVHLKCARDRCRKCAPRKCNLRVRSCFPDLKPFKSDYRARL